MPAEAISEMTEQQVSTVDEDSLKQSKPDLPHNELPDDVPTTSFPSKNELTNGLKRPLPDGVDSDKKKKIRLTDLSEDEFEDTYDNNGINPIELLIQKVSETLENTLGVKESKVLNKTHNLNNDTNSTHNIINHNDKNGIDDKYCKEEDSDKNITSKYINTDGENKTSNINKVINSCEVIENGEKTVHNGENKLAENNTCTSKGISNLNKSSSSDKNVVDDIPLVANLSTSVNDSTVRESNSNHSNTEVTKIKNIVNSKKNDAERLPVIKNKIQNSTKNTDETKIIESRPCNSKTNKSKEVGVCSNGIDQDFEVIDSDTNSDVSLSDLTDLPEDITSIVSGVHQMTKESFPQLLKLFSKKELTYDQFDSMCTQKMIEIITEKLDLGKDRSELQLLKEREKHWRVKYCSLNRQFKEIKTILSVHKQDIKTNEHARPHLITRTVGLQAVLRPKKEGIMKLPELPIPLSKPDTKPDNKLNNKPNNKSVSFVVDNDDNEGNVVAQGAVESANSSTSNIANKTTKKQISAPLVTLSKTPVVSPKTVTAGKSLNPIKLGTTIDLTGNDDVTEESNVSNSKEPLSPMKVLRRSPAILPAQMNGNLSKTLTYVPNNPSSSSSCVVRKSSTITSGSSQQTIVSNKDTINKINNGPILKNLKPILIEVPRVDPVLVQPCTVAYTAQRVPVSQISGTLQPISTNTRQITVSQLSASLKTLTPVYTTCQLPVSRVSGSLPGIALPRESLRTAIRLPISIRSIPQPTSTEQSLTGSQSNKPPPPPPGIPISAAHPSPVPGIPNQRNLSSWKKLPPAPKVTITKTVESKNIPQSLVISWNMIVNKAIAEIVSYQIFAYQETPNLLPSIDLWKKVGEVKALPLPMACSLSQYSNGDKYHFLVRAVDVHNRVGPFSAPQSTT